MTSEQPAGSASAAIENLTAGGVETPDRCREGVRSKNCSIPDDDECDTFLGAGNGLCDIGTGVVFTPPLDPAILGGDQITTCTPGTDVVVPTGDKLKLRTLIRRSEDGLRKDKDRLRLICRD